MNEKRLLARARERGYAEGLAEARAVRQRREIARKLLATLDDEAIAAATGLEVAEVALLREAAIE